MEEEKKSKKKQLIKIGGIVLACVILGFMISEFVENWQAIKPYLASVKPGILILAVFLYAAAFLATGYNWSSILWRMEPKISKTEYLDIHMTSALARYIPGGIWNIVGKAYMCTEKGVEKSATGASMILEYVFQIISSALFLLCFLPALMKNYLSPLWAAAIAVAFVAVLCFLPFAVRLGTRILGKVFKEQMESIPLKTSYIYGLLVQYIAVWLLTGVGLIVLVQAFSSIDARQGLYLVLSYPVSWVAGFLSPSPNGIGVREGVLRLLLGSSYHYELLLLITLTSRIWTILGEAVAFLVFKILTKAKKG